MQGQYHLAEPKKKKKPGVCSGWHALGRLIDGHTYV
jgi:hypothetical protein